MRITSKMSSLPVMVVSSRGWNPGYKISRIYQVDRTNNQLWRCYFYNEVAEEPEPIPDDAGFEPIWKNNPYTRDKRPRPTELQGLEDVEWKEYVRDECLTIKDVKNMRKGERYKFLVLDRNVFDTAQKEDTHHRSFNPEEYFRDNWIIYTHDTDMKGTIDWSFGESREFEFEIEYSPGCWYSMYDFQYDEYQHYTTFPESTRVGWRGPMLLWEKVKDQPKVWWYDP